MQSNAYSKLFIRKLKEHEVYLVLLPMIPKNFHLYHVKGHQDELIPERLNIQADLIATKKAKPPLNLPLPSAPFAIYIHQKYIHLNFQQRIRESCSEQDAKLFLQSKYNWTASTIQNIEWNLHSKCYKSLSTGEKRNISRYIHHRIPSGKMMFELKHRCPYCRLLPNSTTDHDHFLTCINSSLQKDTRIKTLTNRLDRLNTPPPPRNMILHHVNIFYNNDLLPDLPIITTNLTLDDCINKQTSIGWEHFIRGRLTSSFHPILNRYYRSNKLGRRFKSSNWCRNIIRVLW